MSSRLRRVEQITDVTSTCHSKFIPDVAPGTNLFLFLGFNCKRERNFLRRCANNAGNHTAHLINTAASGWRRHCVVGGVAVVSLSR
jgi:hypothetical protein